MPAISSPVLLAVFEYLYTGTLLTYEPKSWRIVCELMIASKFFLLTNLEIITSRLLHLQTSGVADNLPKAACLLTEAVAVNSLSDEIDVHLTEFVIILRSNWSDSECVKSLSEDAFDYLLKNSWGGHADDGTFSFDEYLRFRQVIRWWAYHSDYESCAAEELLAFIAPDENAAFSLCFNPGSDDWKGVESPPEDAKGLSQDWNRLQAHEASRDSVMRLASNIDCRCIHPALLAKVVEPLKVVSDGEILNSFRFHALRRPLTFKMLKCHWDYDCDGGETCCTVERGNVLKETRDFYETAVITSPISRASGVCSQWHFILEISDDVFAEMGFIYVTGKPELDSQRLSYQDLYDAMLIMFHRREVSVGMRRIGESVNGRVLGSKARGIIVDNASNTRKYAVVLNYNAVKHVCSLSINGREFGVVWENLPSETSRTFKSFGFPKVARDSLKNHPFIG
ncbi:unnamed protein product [Calypogeia fissa]